MRRYFNPSMLLPILLLSCLPVSGGTLASFKAENNLKGLTLTPVERPTPAAGAEAPLRIRFDVHNQNPRVVSSPEIEVGSLARMGRSGVLMGLAWKGISRLGRGVGS